MSSTSNFTPRYAQGPALSALVTVRWGDATVAARHLEGDAEALVGAASATIAPIPCEPVGAAAVVVARVRAGGAVAFVPRGAVGFRERPRVLPSPISGPSEITLSAGETVSFSIGQFLIAITAEETSKAPWGGLPPVLASLSSLRYFGVAAAVHALLIGLSAQAAFASSLVDETPDHEEMARYLAAAEDRSRAQEEVESDFGAGLTGRDVNQHDGNGKKGGGERAAGREGAMGAPESRSRDKGRFGVTGDKGPVPDHSASSRSERAQAPHGPDPFSREEAIADARSFGMVGVLAANRPRGPVSGFAHAAANGPDPFSADGAMWGTAIGETFGAGGLGLSGTGEGGGGDGRGIGVGSIGTLGHTFGDAGFGTGGAGSPGFGVLWGGSWSGSWHGGTIGIGRIGTIGHVASGPVNEYDLNTNRRPKSEEQEEQRLPPDAIRRIVQQSHGLFRACYQKALRSNPSLSGTVTTRFLIGARGAVASAQNLSHSLPDGQVVTCVTAMFRGLVFPEPPGGRPVTVTYPLTFSPER